MQRRLITGAAAIALAVSGWATSARAQALSGDPDQNRKPGVAAGKEVNGAVGVHSDDNTNTTANGTSTANTGATAAQATNPQTQLPLTDTDGIRRTISQVTETALKPDGIGQISQYIATEDANRLRDIGQKNSILDQQIQKFQDNWKQKYNQEFAIKDQQLVLNDRNVQIVPGAIVSAGGNGTAGPSNLNTGGGAAGATATPSEQTPASAQNATSPGATSPNTTAGNAASASPNATAATGVNPNPTAANSQTPNPNPTAAPNNAPTGAADATPASARQPAANATINSGNNNVATVMIPASHNMPEASVVVTREATPSAAGAASATTETWKLDIPNSTDARQLQANLARQLRTLNDAKSTWPASANDAYNMVTHAVVLAISQPGQYPPETHQRNLNNTNTNRANPQQQPTGTRSNINGGTGSTGAATGVGGPGSGTTGAGSTGSQSTGAGPSDNNTTGAGSTGSGGQNP